MKTEKRLTMALSVLVALMMLAVPLASSSNLFVDGGQTNSNGDAPNLGAASSNDDITIKDVYIITSIEDLKKLPIYDDLKKVLGKTNDTDMASYSPALITVYTASDKVAKVGADGKPVDGKLGVKFNIECSSTTDNNKTGGYSGLNLYDEAKKEYYFTAPLGSFTGDSDALGIGANKQLNQVYTVKAQLYDKDNKEVGSEVSRATDVKASGLKMQKVWIIDDDASLALLNNYPNDRTGEDVVKWMRGYPASDDSGKWNTWDKTHSPWLAIAFTTESAGNYDLSVAWNGATSSKEFKNSHAYDAGNHLFVISLGTEETDNLGLEKETYENNAYTVTIEGVNTITGGVTYGEPGKVYSVTFKLNADGKSLDKVTATLPSNDTTKGISWSLNADGDVVATVTNPGVTIEDLISIISDKITKPYYTLTGWTDEKNVTYDNKTYTSDNKGETEVKNDLVLSSVWELNDGCAEVPVKVIFGDETKDYVKAYPFSDNKESKIKIIANELDQAIKDAADFNLYGVVVGNYTLKKLPSIEQVYKDGKVTYDGDKELPSNSVISSDSTITVTYEFNDRSYSKLTVHSEAFKDGADVVLYVRSGFSYNYVDVLLALCYPFDEFFESKAVNVEDHGIKPALTLNLEYYNGGPFDKDHNALTSDGYYLLTGWNNSAELLDAVKLVPDKTSELTLDSELNGYYVIFMVNGEYEVVKVPYGELAANKCTLSVDGLNHWVYLSYDKYTKDFSASDLSTFNFTKSQISVIESLPNDHKTPIAVFVACFYPSSSTAYAVFDAGNANFGNEYVTKIITSGKVGNSIILPKDVPSFGTEEDRTVFIGWDDGNEVPVLKAKVPVLGAQYSSEQKYEKNLVSEYTPTVVDYTYKITFYNGSEVVGTFYYDGAVPTSNIVTGLVAFENNEKAYAYPANGYTGLSEEGKKAFNDVKFPHKDGYTLKQWNDVDGKKIIAVEQIKTEPYYEFGKTEIKDMKDDLSLYAKFDANKYTIVYNSAIAAAINEMKQDGYVDDPLKLLSEATFSNEGHKLLSWNTRADGLGDSYKLGADFTLTGAQYEDLKDKDGNATITLYAIWDTTPGSGDNPGGSTGGDGDNTALYLIAGMLAIIAILAIVGIVLMRRKN